MEAWNLSSSQFLKLVKAPASPNTQQAAFREAQMLFFRNDGIRFDGSSHLVQLVDVYSRFRWAR